MTRQEVIQKIIARAADDSAYKQELINNPKAVLAQEGFNIPDDIKVTVLEETPTHFTVVLPITPKANELSESDLESVAGGAAATQGADFGGSWDIMWD